MALVGRRDGRNVGHGRQLSYAVLQALRDLFGGVHFTGRSCSLVRHAKFPAV